MNDSLTPNGFESYLETHYEIVTHLELSAHLEGSTINIRLGKDGRGRMYELAQFLTTKFEQNYDKNRWAHDGGFIQFVETIHVFLNNEDSYIGF